MVTTIKRPLAISSQINKPSSHSQRFDNSFSVLTSLASHDHISLQFFTQSNPLNNLNIASSIPPILQRQNSAPTQQQSQAPTQNQSNGDFFKLNKTVAQPVPSAQRPTPSTAGEIHRKFSLPMNTLSSQPMVATSSYMPPMMRKQSAPTIHPIVSSSQQQFQQQPHSSPSRARDRNNFDKVPLIQDVQQLPFLKGGLNCSDVHLILFSSFMFH